MWWCRREERGVRSEADRGRRLMIISCLVPLASCLSSCGFQLRGEPAVGIRTLHVSSVPNVAVAAEIRRALATGPTRVVGSPAEGEAHLRILGEARDKTVFTITGTGRVYEFQLQLTVRYEMTVPGREAPV